MPEENVNAINQIRGELVKQGYTMRAWARKHNYSQQLVFYAVRMDVNRTSGVSPQLLNA